MTNLMGSFVRCRISVSNSLAALADAKLSITATPSSPMTKPPFAAATPFAAGLSIAAHTFEPTCFSVNGGTAVLCACPTSRIQSRAHDATTAKRARPVVRMISFGHRWLGFGLISAAKVDERRFAPAPFEPFIICALIHDLRGRHPLRPVRGHVHLGHRRYGRGVPGARRSARSRRGFK